MPLWFLLVLGGVGLYAWKKSSTHGATPALQPAPTSTTPSPTYPSSVDLSKRTITGNVNYFWDSTDLSNGTTAGTFTPGTPVTISGHGGTTPAGGATIDYTILQAGPGSVYVKDSDFNANSAQA